MPDLNLSQLSNYRQIRENLPLSPTEALLELAVYCFDNSCEALPSFLKSQISNLFASSEVALTEAKQLIEKLQPEIILTLCLNSPLGKHLPNALYVHYSALNRLDPILQLYEKIAYLKAGTPEHITLVKFQPELAKISYLFYPDFEVDPHPALSSSIQVEMKSFKITYRDYSDNNNPPVLHRKETFLAPDSPYYQEFAELTRQEEVLGLLNDSKVIGTKIGWQNRLNLHKITFENHYLTCPIHGGDNTLKLRIERHKAAIHRTSLSRPVRRAFELGLFTEKTTFFDYGCGYGDDVKRIAEKGFSSNGWDPYYFNQNDKQSADIVNISYVINVIEDPQERSQALKEAWQLTKQVLLVSAQILIDDRQKGWVAYSDGIITSRNTFQKYYQQEELKTYIDQVLEVDAIPLDLGIYFVFRNESEAEFFRVLRCRSRAVTPRIRKPLKRFEDYQSLLTPLIEFVSERGRLPVGGELVNEAEIKEELGTFRRAFTLVLQATEAEEWEKLMQKRRQDLLIYLALSRFSKRPKPVELSFQVKEDIKGLFGSYKQACWEADILLFSAGNLHIIRESCENSPLGLLLNNSFLIHLSALEQLEPLLRVYEGCASRTTGRLEKVNVIQLHTKTAKISYLYYPDFDEVAHPILHSRMQVNLQDLRVSYENWQHDKNPPILHHKEKLVSPDYPLYEKFARLTQQEIKHGLFEDLSATINLQDWLKNLQEHCAVIVGHRVHWQKDVNPYRLKLEKSAMRSRIQHSKD